MSYPILKRGKKGPSVVSLQTCLNKTGTMLVTDGDFGPATERGVRYARAVAGLSDEGVADTSLWQWLDKQSEPFPPLNTNGVAFIAREETGGLSYYNRHSRQPHYPGVASGITIGIGYDLRFTTLNAFRKAWRPWLSAEQRRELEKDIAKKGSKQRAKTLESLGVDIPFHAAWSVFVATTLPTFYNTTKKVYPSLERLPDLCRTVLVSLVYNRGSSMKGSSRREMRQIQTILAAADQQSLTLAERKLLLREVEDVLLNMQRLWKPGSGLLKRRQHEANLWRQGQADWK